MRNAYACNRVWQMHVAPGAPERTRVQMCMHTHLVRRVRAHASMHMHAHLRDGARRVARAARDGRAREALPGRRRLGLWVVEGAAVGLPGEKVLEWASWGWVLR